MADVSTWDPSDENNNKPPPDGWPEFMMPSQVNNSARMMMGAVKRMYDQQVSGAIVLPYLKLAGGAGGQTVTGPVTFAGITAAAITSNGTINAASTISTTGNITAAGAVQGLDVNASRNMSVAGTLYGGALSGSSVYVTGRVTAGNGEVYGSGWALTGSGGNLNIGTGASGNLGTLTLYTNTLNVQGSIGTTGAITAGNQMFVNAGGLMVWNGNITANTGNVIANGITSNGNISAANTVAANNLTVATNATISGTLTVSAIQNNGNINAGGYTGNGMSLSGEVRGNTLRSTGDTTVGSVCYVASVVPHTDNTGLCGSGSSGWHDVCSYNYVTLSDASLKTDIGPLPDTLALVSALAPQAFRYGDEDVRHWGFVAQDVRAAVSGYPVDLVSGEEGRLGLDYGGLTAMLWKAVQELNARLTALEGR